MTTPTADYFHRVIVVDTTGDAVIAEVSHAVSAAYDLLVDDGMTPDRAAAFASMAELAGRDPEAMARKLRQLRTAFR